MKIGLEGKYALICGASSGIGLAVAKTLAAEGVSMVMCSSNQDRIEKAAEEVRAVASGAKILPVRADLSKSTDIEALVGVVKEEFGALDILFNNTGGPPASQFLEVTDEMWSESFDSLFMSVVRLCRACVPIMANREGVIVNLLSRSAKESLPNLVISNALRAAIAALSKTMSVELAPYRIRVNNVIPGMIRTQRQSSMIKKRAQTLKKDESTVEAQMVESIPLRRLGDAGEVASLVAFLCSTHASYITGSSFSVDGGALKSNI